MIRDGVFLLRCWALISLWVALACFWRSLQGGVPMPPETHSSAMYAIPAEVWALGSLAQALAFFWVVGTRRYLTMAAIASIGAVVNLALAVFSNRAEFGFIQSLVSGGVGMMHCVIVVAALVDALGCRIVLRAERIVARVIHRDD